MAHGIASRTELKRELGADCVFLLTINGNSGWQKVGMVNACIVCNHTTGGNYDQQARQYAWFSSKGFKYEIGQEEVRALLDTTPAGEGVYIAPDGTLMRAVGWLPADPGRKLNLYRPVPIEEEP